MQHETHTHHLLHYYSLLTSVAGRSFTFHLIPELAKPRTAENEHPPAQARAYQGETK